MKDYFTHIQEQTNACYALAHTARSKGLDPVKNVEVILAKNMAERVLGLISVVSEQIRTSKLVERITALEKQYGAQDWRVALSIALETAQGTICPFSDPKEAMEVAIRIGLAYITNGVVSSPLEGFTQLELKPTRDGKQYFALHYSGPIRSAGGTAEAVSLIIADYVRKNMGYAPYDPNEPEIKRIATELYDYHEKVTNLQYLPSEQEIEYMIAHLPVQVTGDPSEKFEVSNHKGLERIGTDRIRGGVCLVIGEGICQKAAKVLKQLSKWGNSFGLTPWVTFLEEFVALQKTIKARAKKVETPQTQEATLKPDYTFIKDLVAGRPILTDPLGQGGFRLRYGRCRTSGLSAQAIHPSTMIITNKFIAIGTQLKIERPSKGCVVAACDTIEGPIIKLTNGDVLRVEDVDVATKNVDAVAEILYLGDLLISYGDFFNRAHVLAPAGYCEEWWALELERAIRTTPPSSTEEQNLITSFLSDPLHIKPTITQALLITKIYAIPLHPRYTFHWASITPEDVLLLAAWITQGSTDEGKIILPNPQRKEKRTLELLGVPHRVISNEYIVISDEWATALLTSLTNLRKDATTVLDMLNPELHIRDKNGTFIGARMGRPEKAKMRKLIGSPQVLFPVGEEGGRLRAFQAALEKKVVTAQFPLRFCDACTTETIYPSCERCGTETRSHFSCFICKTDRKEKCHDTATSYKLRPINITHYFTHALSLTHSKQYPQLIKGVRGTSNKHHIPEHLTKGILRAIHNIYVNKDGTTRYDMTEMPITHFKPKEIGTSIQTLKKLGYTHDIHTLPLTNDDQVLELKPQDIILPAAYESLDETADNVFFRIAAFVDDLLEHFYGLKRYYSLKTNQDLIGHLVVGLAPHISAGVVGRIIGFSATQALLAHPYFHSVVRRDCDGDEVCCMLLLDTLLNFSRSYLPSSRGSTQDTPLVLTSTIIATEVDDMIFDMDVAWKYPLDLYEKSQSLANPWDVKVEQLKERLGTPKEFQQIGYTHEVNNFNQGVPCSAYKSIPTMQDKVKGQMLLAERIRAVNQFRVAELIIDRHFLRDIKGNLRKFSTQEFRCVKCNEKYRRPPLIGVCIKCKGNLLFTVSQGNIVKYLEPSMSLLEKYNLPPYLAQTLYITKQRVESIFGKDPDKQAGLGKWF